MSCNRCVLSVINRRVMILLEVTIIASGATVGKKIGNPQQFKAGQTSNEQAQSENKPVVQQPVQNLTTPLSSNMNNGTTKSTA